MSVINSYHVLYVQVPNLMWPIYATYHTAVHYVAYDSVSALHELVRAVPMVGYQYRRDARFKIVYGVGPYIDCEPTHV